MATGAVLSQSATIVGLMAGSIAVGGFIAHAGPALSGQQDAELRFATVVGGLCGLAISLLAILLAAMVG